MMKRKPFQWNFKRQRFVKEYPKDLNGTRAAIRAGYSPKTANQQASRLLTNVNIQKAISQQVKNGFQDAEIEVADVLRELKSLAFSNISDYVSFGPAGVILKSSEDITKEKLAAVAEVSESYSAAEHRYVRFKLYAKEKALEMLGRYLNLFAEDNKKGLDITFANIALRAKQAETADKK